MSLNTTSDCHPNKTKATKLHTPTAINTNQHEMGLIDPDDNLINQTKLITKCPHQSLATPFKPISASEQKDICPAGIDY